MALAVTNHYRNTRLSYRTGAGPLRELRRLDAGDVPRAGRGTDRSAPWLLALFAAAVAAVLAATASRFRCGGVLAGGIAVGGVALVVLLAVGPLRFTPGRGTPRPSTAC